MTGLFRQLPEKAGDARLTGWPASPTFAAPCPTAREMISRQSATDMTRQGKHSGP
jgi:hypothetical protein